MTVFYFIINLIFFCSLLNSLVLLSLFPVERFYRVKRKHEHYDVFSPLFIIRIRIILFIRVRSVRTQRGRPAIYYFNKSSIVQNIN